MVDSNRRRLLRVGSALAVGTLAGCLGGGGSATESPSPSPPKRTADGTETHPLTDWERSTDCDSMHDSVVSVKRVRESLGRDYDPIRFADLTDGEKRILRAVTTEGGYGTCEAGESFHRFVERVGDHGSRQAADDMRVYLERDGTYYGLYVENLDQVYAY